MFGESEYDPYRTYLSVPIEEQLEALAAAKRSGKIRHIGLSNETAWGVMRFCEIGMLRTVEVVNSMYISLHRAALTVCAFDTLCLSARHITDSTETVALQNAYRCLVCFTLLPFCPCIGSECK